MKKSFLFFALALSLVELVACKGQKRSDVQKESNIEEQPTYFTDQPAYFTTDEGDIEEIDSDDDPAYNTIVEVMPEFPGGNEALLEYLRKNQRFPEEAREKGIKGRVVVTFIVEKDGSISNVEILRSIASSLSNFDLEVVKPIISLIDKEAVRLVRDMPKWKPGEQKGEKTRVKYTLPISFPPRNPFENK